MLKSSREFCILASALFLFAGTVSAQDQSVTEPSIPNDEGQDIRPSGFFPELAPEGDSLSILGVAAREIIEQNLQKSPEEITNIDRAQYGMTIKGIFENLTAWHRSTVSVCFIPPSSSTAALGPLEFSTLSRKVKSIARDWTKVPGIPELDLGPGETIQECSAGKFAIAVAFTQSASDSQIGSDSLRPAQRGEASMNLQLKIMRSGDEATIRHLVLHEFGHALGLLHEFGHTSGQCWSKLKVPELYDYYKREYGITDQLLIRRKLATYDPVTLANSATVTSFDTKSVMMYSLPDEVYNDLSPPCRAGINAKISDGDVKTVQLAYRSRGAALMQLASIASRIPPGQRRIVDAFIASQAAEETIRDELREAIDRKDLAPSPKETADAVFATLHSERVQTLQSRQD